MTVADAAAIVHTILASPDRPARLREIDRFLSGPDAKSLSLVLTQLGSKNSLRTLLEVVARPAATVPREFVSRLTPILAERNLPITLRIAAAAKLVETDPEDHVNVKAIAMAVTKGLGRSKTFDRLVQVQSRVYSSLALDALVTSRERRVQLKCPKCSARLPRAAFIRHLWFEHRLVFENGQARDAGPAVEAAIQSAARDDAPNAFDRVYALAAVSFRKVDPSQIHQAILARTGADPEDLEPLQQQAREHNIGLCPTCYAKVPNPVPPLPPPLNLSRHRISGEGFELDLGEVSAARKQGVKFALPAAFGTVAAAAFASPLAALAVGVGLSGLLYNLGSRRGKSGSDLKAAVVEAAWRDLVPKVGRSAEAVRFLTRLCRNSLDHGNAELRTEAVWSQVEQAAVLSGKGGTHLQWFAAVRVLQASDAGHIGKDWIPALTGLFAPLFRAEASPLYTEAAAETLEHADSFEDRDAARLRVFLAGEALAANLSTPDFVALCEVCPHLARLFAGNDAWFDALAAVWRIRIKRPWNHIGDAKTVFEFAVSPAAGVTLAAYPDTLLVFRFEENYDRELGPVLIGPRGVTVADVTVSDTNASVTIEDGRSDGSILQFGPHQLTTRRRLPDRVAVTLRKWLRYREELLTIATTLNTTPRLTAILSMLATECPLCRRMCLVKTGELGTPWPLTD
ncbi:hypothetical protein BH11PLA2_BH11PLA2_51730 [soil metagenome]